jgi:hypothetical protein
LQPGALFPEKSQNAVSPARGFMPGCGNGYRFAKRQGKPNSANLAVVQQNERFGNLASCNAPNPFRFDSSRTLNCSSNLIGHDHPNKPANGGGD